MDGVAVKPVNLELHIDELVLEGLPGLDGAEMKEVFKQELQRQFVEKGIPGSLSNGGSVEKISGGTVTVADATDANSVAGQLAQNVYGGLKR